MPLEVTASPTANATGAGPPGQLAGADFQQPADIGAILFASLLAQKTLPAAGKSQISTDLAPDAPLQKPTNQKGKTPTRAAGNSPTQALDPAMATWAALAALQTAPTAAAVDVAGSAKVVAPTKPENQNEVMDAVSKSASVPANAENANSGLLPQMPAAVSAVKLASPSMPMLQTADAPTVAVSPPIVSTPSATAALETAVASQHASAAAPTEAATPIAAAPSSATSTPTTAVQLTTPIATAQPAIAMSMGVGASLLSAEGSIPAASTEAAPTPAAVKPVATLPVAPAVSPDAHILTKPMTPTAIMPAALPDEQQISLQNIAVPANNTGKLGAAPVAPSPSAAKSASAQVATSLAKKLGARIGAVLAGNQNANSGKEPGRSQPEGEDRMTAQAFYSQNSISAAAAPLALAAQIGGDQPLAPVSVKPLDRAQAGEVVQQITENVSAAKPHVLATGQGQMTVQLHPKEWGDLRVTISLTPAQSIDGVKQTTVAAHIVASSPEVKDALADHSSDLNQALHDIGLHLDRLTVTVQATTTASQAGTATSDGQGGGQNGAGQAPTSQSQTWAGGTGAGRGSALAFAGFSQGHGGSAFSNQADTTSQYFGRDSAEQEVNPITTRVSSSKAGFDRRA